MVVCKVQIDNYLFDLSNLIEVKNSRRVSRVLLEAPPGMIRLLPRLAEYLSSSCLNGVDTIIKLEPVYGLCSVSLGYLKSGIVDLIIHIGHDFYPYPLCYGSTCISADRLTDEGVVVAAGEYVVEEETVEKLADSVVDIVGRGSSIIIGFSAQHRLLSSRLAGAVAARGVKVVDVVPVLGCYYYRLLRRKADYYLIVAGGYFHALGAALSLNDGRRVIRVDPYTARVESIEKEYVKVISKRYWIVGEARRAHSFGVIVGMLPGQYRPGIVDVILKLLKRYGRRYHLIYAERVDREFLDNLSPREYDAFIVTSCPRLAVDDLSDYWKPVLTPGEALMAIRGDFTRYTFPW